jgi:hypothetical protein
LALLLPLFAGVSRASPVDNGGQLAGLFMQSCMAFVGNRTGLRDWAHRTGLAELPDPARAVFLHGVPGVVFDASNPSGKFVLISDDGGGCSAVAEKADGPSLFATLESDMRQVGVGFRLRGDAADAEEKQLQHREYTAWQGSQKWRIVVGTVRDQQGGQAMLTANPE